jgi:hypothetical protein
MHERFHRKVLSDADLCKEITKMPPTQLQQGKTPPGHTLRPAQSPQCEAEAIRASQGATTPRGQPLPS